MALKRALRLRKNTDFQRVRQHGCRCASRLLILTYAPNNLMNVRIGFVVSKRTSKLAVERNYVKRLLAEAIRPLLEEIPMGWDIVFSAKNASIGLSLATLRQDVQHLLRRARLSNPSSLAQESQS